MICQRCGKERHISEGHSFCWVCEQEMEQDKIQKDFQEWDETEEGSPFDTWSTDYVICPHCGYAIPTDLGYEYFPEIYEDGSHKITCPECDKDFILETSVSYSYETKKGEGESG